MSKADTLATYLPDYLTQSKLFQAAFKVDGAELDTVAANNTDILNQCFVATATWGLKYWEQFLGIVVDETKDADYRRSVIVSKIRGAGTITVAMIQNVAESYENGEVDITEYPAQSYFTVTFVGTLGIPPNLDDLKAAIEAIKPAHLGVTYVFTYMTWAQLEGYNHMWDEWDAKNLTWDELTVHKE